MGKEKIGLTLAGGGAKGAYQIGVYRAMLDCNIKIEGITGTSIGSFNAAMIAAGDFYKLEEFWLNEDVGKLLGFDGDMNIDKKNYKDKLKELSIPIKSVLKNKGIPITGLKSKLEEIVDEDKLRKSKLDYGLVTYKVKTKEALYMYKEDIPKGNLTDYIVASCYLPVFHYEKLHDDSYYLDGSFYDAEPYTMLVKKGYTKIYVVELGAIGVTHKNKSDVKIIRIKPSRSLGMMLNTNTYKIKENMELGYYDAIKKLKKLDGNKYVFKKHSNWYYNLLVRNMPKRIRKRAEIFFLTRNNKELVIKSIEYVLKKEEKTYMNIYTCSKEIKRLKKRYKKDKSLIVYEFISNLKLF
ncbi:MAG: patatin-like phospholipase family protein [bacterium]